MPPAAPLDRLAQGGAIPALASDRQQHAKCALARYALQAAYPCVKETNRSILERITDELNSPTMVGSFPFLKGDPTMIKKLFTGNESVQEHRTAPLAESRLAFLNHSASQGYSPDTLRRIATAQLAVVRHVSFGKISIGCWPGKARQAVSLAAPNAATGTPCERTSASPNGAAGAPRGWPRRSPHRASTRTSGCRPDQRRTKFEACSRQPLATVLSTCGTGPFFCCFPSTDCVPGR